MKIKKSALNNIGFSVFSVVFLFGFVILVSSRPSATDINSVNAISINGFTQIIDVTAKGGYSPSLITAVANKETILRINTNNTFDCSSALVIPKLGIQKNLPVTGNTDINLGTQASGSEIDATCSMGMYGFKIKFI